MEGQKIREGFLPFSCGVWLYKVCTSKMIVMALPRCGIFIECADVFCYNDFGILCLEQICHIKDLTIIAMIANAMEDFLSNGLIKGFISFR